MTAKLAGVLIAACAFLSPRAHAGAGYVRISDVSQLKMQSDRSVYFRNLNGFDSSVAGCCYWFYLDTSTAAGKSAWALILAKMATASGLWFHLTETVPTSAAATVDQVGDW